MKWTFIVLLQILASASASEPRLNFLLIMGDDISSHTMASFGGQAQTPNLDKLTQRGLQFSKAYSNEAMCAPFRQELFSGRCNWRTGTLANHSKSAPDTKSLPHYLKPAGYNVGLVGKFHVGPNKCYPFDRLGDGNKNSDNNELLFKLGTSYIEKAIHTNAPFCLVVASNDGHEPYTTGNTDLYPIDQIKIPPYLMDTKETRKKLSQHYAEITNLDALLGRYMRYLNLRDLIKNTVVIFCSEQGNSFPFAKWTAFDYGLKTGLVASCPGTIRAGICSEIMWVSDLAPTLCEAAGVRINANDFDGKSQWGNFTGEPKQIHQFAFGAFTNCNIIDNRERIYPIRSIRNKSYSLIWSPLHQGITSNTKLSLALKKI